MSKLIDKLIILIITLALYIPNVNNIYMIVPILIVVSISALLSYIENENFILGIFISYVILCFFKPIFLFFLPLISYDILIFHIKWTWLLALLPLLTNATQAFTISSGLIASFLVVAYILKYRTTSLQNIKRDYYELQYNTKEISMQLEKKNKELLEKQDYEINLATLNERNRIARDIHDNVGHMLSRSILQVGALLAIGKDDNTKTSLYDLKETLSEAMDSIRNSVHDLHEESIDLYTELQKIIDNFTFCPINFEYSIENSIDRNIKYCFISIIKEAMANVIKHSNATKVSIIIREHPAIYQLIVQDNGTNTTSKISNGIGLKNIEDRITAFNGNVNISVNSGFKIFISIPKN